jgi:hypothetical protein
MEQVLACQWDWLQVGFLAMDWTTIVTATVTALVSFAVAYGMLSQSHKDVARHLASLAVEMNRKFVDLEAAKATLSTSLSTQVTAIAILQEKIGVQMTQLASLERNKASVDALDSMKEYLGRIDGKLDLLMMSLVKPKGGQS